jgi:protein SCO1/2
MKKSSTNSSQLKLILAVLGVTLLFAGLMVWNGKPDEKTLPYYEVVVGSSDLKEMNKPSQKKVGNFSFRDQHNELVTQDSLHNAIYVVDYIFTTCPGICLAMSSNMNSVYKEYKGNPEVKFLSHTSKPEEDNPYTLSVYAERIGAANKNQWYFLTGELKELQRMAIEEYGVVNPEDLEEEGSFVHSDLVVLIDQQKNIRGYYSGIDTTEMNQLKQDIKILLNE